MGFGIFGIASLAGWVALPTVAAVGDRGGHTGEAALNARGYSGPPLPSFEDFRRADRERRTTGQLHTAASLALTRIDTNLIARAAAAHPADPEILFGAAELGGDWETALRANRTNNVVALRYALTLVARADRQTADRWLQHGREHDPGNLVPRLGDGEAPAGAARFDDYEVPAARARIRCLEAAGYSAYAARRLGVLADKPALAWARAGMDQQPALFRLRVGRALQASPPFLVTELVGQSVEVAALKAMSDGPIRGEAADRVTELSNWRETLQALLKETELRAVELATEEEMVRYFDDVLTVGEETAMKRLLRSVRQPPEKETPAR